MKKHSKTGVEARFQGTVLGHPAEPKPTKIEGGPAESIEDWCRLARERARNEAAEAALHTPAATLKDGDMRMDDVSQEETQGASEEVTEDTSKNLNQSIFGDGAQYTSTDGAQDATGDVTQTSSEDMNDDGRMDL